MDIIVVDPNGNQRKYNIEAFQKEVVSFGRQPDNDIVFNYDFVSRVHGVIYREGMQYYIEDMNSTNGIYVNGSRTKRAKLNTGDNIVLARSFQDGSRIEMSVGDKVVVQQPYVQPYQQPVYADANTNAVYGNYMPQQPMARYKFIIYFQLFFSAFICGMLAFMAFSTVSDMQDSRDSMQYLEWADDWFSSSYAESIDSIKTQYVVLGILAAFTAIVCIFVRNELAEFKVQGPRNYYIVNFLIAASMCLNFAVTVQIAVIEENTGAWIESGGNTIDDTTGGAILMGCGVIMVIAAGYVILNKVYFDKRKHLFTR